MLRAFATLCCLFALGGCASTAVEDYAANTPRFNVETFFQGELVAHGVLKDRSGKVTRYFSAELEGHWDQGVGTLEEWFVFDDGEKQKRVWTLKPNQEGGYTATAGDVIGTGTLKTSGNALFLTYTLRVPYDGDTLDLDVDDRMYLITPNHLINESELTKFGFKVGSLTLSIQKRAAAME